MWKRIKAVLFSLFLIVLACLSIYIGIYFYELSKPEVIVLKAFSNIGNKLNKYLIVPSEVKIDDTFSLEGNIDFNLNSEVYKEGIKYNKINNLNKMDSNILIQSNKNDKKVNLVIKSNIGEESIINIRNLIENSTDYYYYGDILNQYVNNGTCNYFETIDEETTVIDNIKYLRDATIKAFASTLDDDYTKIYQKKENILGKDMDVNEITIKFTNRSIYQMKKKILKELKKDEKANQILNNYFNDFDNYKIDENKEYLEKNEYYMLHIYSTNIWYEPIKYKIDHMNGDSKESISYEVLEEDGEYYYLENDSVKYKGKVLFNKNNISASITNSAGHDLGEFKLENGNDSILVSYHLDDGKDKKELYYTSKYVKENDIISNEKSLEFKKIENNQNKLSGNIVLNFNLSKNSVINEDVSNTVLVNTLSEETKDSIKNYPDTVKSRLERQ